jgi:hypothetical protein
MNTRNSAGEGAGLVLTRKVGERIIIGASPDASDAEILDAIRSGLIISLVDVSQPRRGPSTHSRYRSLPTSPEPGNVANPTEGWRLANQGNRHASESERSMHQAQAREQSSTRGSARIGLKGSRALTISREEILPHSAAAG